MSAKLWQNDITTNLEPVRTANRVGGCSLMSLKGRPDHQKRKKKKISW